MLMTDVTKIIQSSEINNAQYDYTIIMFLLLTNLTLFLSCLQGVELHKTVFIIFFQGDQLKSRVKKICEA